MGSSNCDRIDYINALCIDVDKILYNYRGIDKTNAKTTKKSAKPDCFAHCRKSRLHPITASLPPTLAPVASTQNSKRDDQADESEYCFWSPGAKNPLPPLSPADPLVLDAILRNESNAKDNPSSTSSLSHDTEKYRVSCSFLKPKTQFVIKHATRSNTRHKRHQRFYPGVSSQRRLFDSNQGFINEPHLVDLGPQRPVILNGSLADAVHKINSAENKSRCVGFHSPVGTLDLPTKGAFSTNSSCLASEVKGVLQSSVYPTGGRTHSDIKDKSVPEQTLIGGHDPLDLAEPWLSLHSSGVRMHSGVSKIAAQIVTLHNSLLVPECRSWGLPVLLGRDVYSNSRTLRVKRLLGGKNHPTNGAAATDAFRKAVGSRNRISGKNDLEPEFYSPLKNHLVKRDNVPGPWRRNGLVPATNTRRPKKK